MEQIALIMTCMLSRLATGTFLCCNEKLTILKSLVCDYKKQNRKNVNSNRKSEFSKLDEFYLGVIRKIVHSFFCEKRKCLST